jgi:hypothetical protein
MGGLSLVLGVLCYHLGYDLRPSESSRALIVSSLQANHSAEDQLRTNAYRDEVLTR